jgi:hypothetical protein
MHHVYKGAFLTSGFVLSALDGKIKQYVCIKFCVKLGKSITKTLEMFCDACLENILETRQ